MKIAIVGTGNSGSAVLMQLAARQIAREIVVCSERPPSAKAAVFDALSAYPRQADAIRVGQMADAGKADIIALCAGAQIPEGKRAADVLQINSHIVGTLISAINPNRNAILIVIASPVDDIAVVAQEASGLAPERVIGFGGDLDRNRLIYSLSRRQLETENATIIGEHGRRAIPVFAGEDSYDEVAGEVRNFLKQLTREAGRPRNLATGVLLTNLMESVALDEGRIHCVCGYHPSFRSHLTWPFKVGSEGLLDPTALSLPKRAQADLNSLLNSKETERPKTKPPQP